MDSFPNRSIALHSSIPIAVSTSRSHIIATAMLAHREIKPERDQNFDRAVLT